MQSNSNAREPLQTLAQHLLAASNSSDGWGDGILGAIGLKKDAISNKYAFNKIENDDKFHLSLLRTFSEDEYWPDVWLALFTP